MSKISTGTAVPELRARLEAADVRGSGKRLDCGEAVVRDLVRNDEIRALVGQILSDDAYLGDIAARSYYHANSFLKLVLMVGDENAWKLRLHMWHPRSEEDRALREDIHSHRWDFTTALVVGEYNAREYMVAPGDEYHHYRYLPVRAGQSFSLEAKGTEELSQVFEGNLPVGTVYHLDHRVLHSIARSGDGPTATVVLQGPAVRDSTNVYRTAPVGTEGGGDTHVERPSIDQLRAELAQFRSWL